MQASSWYHKLSHFIYPIECGKCGKRVKKTKIWLSWEKRVF